MNIEFEAYEIGKVAFEFNDLEPHPIRKSTEDTFDRGIYFENAQVLFNEILTGTNTVVFLWFNNQPLKEKIKSEDKLIGFEILFNYSSRNEAEFLIIAEKSSVVDL